MPEQLVTPTGTVHWVGTGLSTGRTGLSFLAERCELILWGRTRQRARDRVEALGLEGSVKVRGLDSEDIGEQLRPGDVMVSMLPPAHHARLLRTAIDSRAHFACSSYTPADIGSLAAEACESGLVVLTEAGLDPGIDHLMAHRLVEQARERFGDQADRVALTSYCGGIPAEPGEFRYQFSWAPLGVLTALANPARYVRDGQVREIERPWEDTETIALDGEAFEAYPNRDSVGFIEQYDFPDGWQVDSFVRGTFRPQGWRAAWGEVFDVVTSGDREKLATLANELAARYPTTDTDRDRIVLAVSLEVERENELWGGRYALDITGDDTDTAMARCVSSALACGIERICAAARPPGLLRAANGDEARIWLDRLATAGLPWTYHTTERNGQR